MSKGGAAFLDSFPCADGVAPTHTSIPCPGPSGSRGGSYVVHEPRYESFLESYISWLHEGGEPSLTERPATFFPVIADIDLQYPITPGELTRCHGSAFIKAVCMSFSRGIVSMCRSAASSHCLVAHVMQRDDPYLRGNVVRDGVHIIFPDIVLSRPAHALLRQLAMPGISDAILALPGQCLDAETCLDSVYSTGKGNWQMYGSAKPGRDRYLVTHTARIVISDGKCSDAVVDSVSRDNAMNWTKWVRQFSVRKHGSEHAQDMFPSAQLECDAIEGDRANSTVRQIIERHGDGLMTEARDPGKAPPGVVDRVRRMLTLLSSSRSETYAEWRNVGFALRQTSEDLLEDWHAFSARSAKYDRRVCQLFWDKIDSGGRGDEEVLTSRSIEFWARRDSPDAFEEAAREEERFAIEVAIDGNTHTDWANYYLSSHPGSVSSVKVHRSYDIYVFENHRWHHQPGAHTIKNALKGEIAAEVDKIGKEREGREDKAGAKAATSASKSLKTFGFREFVVKDIAESVASESLSLNKDTHKHLVGWNNGVFDLEKQEFRDGRPDDYITLSTKHDFLPPSSSQYSSTRAEVAAFFQAIHKDEALRKYCLDSMAVMLSGVLSFEHMYCWTGTGSNGKSKVVALMRESFGDYLRNLPPSLLTSRRSEAGRPTPELASMRGVRVAVLPEMSATETINVAVMKELTGGDEISVRPLYGDPVPLLPQFSMLLTCNDLSRVDACDEGTWRRLKVLPHNSRFVTREPIEGSGELPADTALDRKLKKWAPYFLAMLQERYPEAVRDMRHEPREIREAVQSYRATSDRDGDFARQYLRRIPENNPDGLEEAYAWQVLSFYKITFHENAITLPKFEERLFKMGLPRLEYRDDQPVIPGYSFRGGSKS